MTLNDWRKFWPSTCEFVFRLDREAFFAFLDQNFVHFAFLDFLDQNFVQSKSENFFIFHQLRKAHLFGREAFFAFLDQTSCISRHYSTSSTKISSNHRAKISCIFHQLSKARLDREAFFAFLDQNSLHFSPIKQGICLLVGHFSTSSTKISSNHGAIEQSSKNPRPKFHPIIERLSN